HHALQYGVPAPHVERRGDGRALDRLAPAAFVRSSALPVVVAAFGGHVEVVDAKRRPRVVRAAHLDRLDTRIPRELSEHGDFLCDHADAIPALELVQAEVTFESARHDAREPLFEAGSLR